MFSFFRHIIFFFSVCFFFFHSVTYVQAQNNNTPNLTIQELVTGLSTPWSLDFTPDGTILFTQRRGVLSAILPDGTVNTVTIDLSDFFAQRTTGLLSVLVDPDFSTNRRFYTCQGHQVAGASNDTREVQVIAWRMNDTYTAATRVNDPLVGGIKVRNDGFHGGGRMRFGPDGYLWICAGDGGAGTVPQDTSALGGKILRVNAMTGAGASDNPFSDYPLVYTLGHRNPQGLALRPGTNEMWSVEHGPEYDDEINKLVSGGNYGWDPVPEKEGDDRYNQEVSMTDTEKYPDAIEAKWSSGSARTAPSGAAFLEGSAWKDWEGRLAVATLQHKKLYLLKFSNSGTFENRIIVPGFSGDPGSGGHGRLRAVVLAPDSSLYVTTSKDDWRTTKRNDDKILRVIPSVAPSFASNNISVSVAESNNSAVLVATVTATNDDDEILSYELSGQDETSFYISDSSVGEVRARVELDYETKNSYHVVVTATDPFHLSDEVTVTINVTDVNEQFAISLDTDDSEGEQFASFLAVSPDGGRATIQVFGKAIPDVNDISMRFEYDPTQVVYEGFKRGPVLSGTSALAGKNFVNIGMTLRETIDDSGLMGTLRFRARDTLTETEIRLVRVKLLGGQSETLPMYLSIALQGSAVALPVGEASADFNGNGTIDIPDFLLFVDVFGLKAGQEQYEAKYDLDRNDEIGIPDFLIFVDNFGKEMIQVPAFTSERPVLRFVEENTPPGQPIGDPISARRAEGESLMYSLWGVDAEYFAIDANTGQLETKEAHNYETRNRYSPIVRVSDGKGGQVSVVVGVAIIDVVE